MMSFITGLLKGLFSLILAILPDSPVQSWITNIDSLQTALGWLNWLFPLGTCVGLSAMYLGLLLAWAGLKTMLGKPLKTVEKLIG